MKKILSLLLTLCLFVAMITTITSCNIPFENKQEQEQEQEQGQEQKQEHVHKVSKNWVTDEACHWHACDDCTEKFDKEEHQWNVGVIVKPATEDTNGVVNYTCTVCSLTKAEQFDLWTSYFDFERMENVTVTSVQTDVTNSETTNTSIKIDGEKWERIVADFSYNASYYETCTVYFDGEKKFLNGEESNCPVFKNAFFSFIDFSQRGDIFTKAESGCYESGENSFKLYGFTVSNVIIAIEQDHLKSISMNMKYGDTLLTLEYEFFDWGTTAIEEIPSSNT